MPAANQRLKQAAIAALAFQIHDTGAAGGIVVTPIGYQPGAAKIAAQQNIQLARMDRHSTTSEYIFHFLNRVFVGAVERIELGGHPIGGTLINVDPRVTPSAE